MTITTNDIRVKNLRKLISKFNGPLALSKQLGYSNASYIVQMGGPNPDRVIGEKTARRIESKLGLEFGWLDKPGADENVPTIDAAKLSEAIELVMTRCTEENLPTSPKRIAKLVSIAYESGDPLNDVNKHITFLKEFSL